MAKAFLFYKVTYCSFLG